MTETPENKPTLIYMEGKGCREPHELTRAEKIVLTKQLFPGIDPAYAEQWSEARK